MSNQEKYWVRCGGFLNSEFSSLWHWSSSPPPQHCGWRHTLHFPDLPDVWYSQIWIPCWSAFLCLEDDGVGYWKLSVSDGDQSLSRSHPQAQNFCPVFPRVASIEQMILLVFLLVRGWQVSLAPGTRGSKQRSVYTFCDFSSIQNLLFEASPAFVKSLINKCQQDVSRIKMKRHPWEPCPEVLYSKNGIAELKPDPGKTEDGSRGMSIFSGLGAAGSPTQES